jgi:hypothetical protein
MRDNAVTLPYTGLQDILRLRSGFGKPKRDAGEYFFHPYREG